MTKHFILHIILQIFHFSSSLLRSAFVICYGVKPDDE